VKECIKKAGMHEAGAREEQVQGLSQEVVAESQNNNKNKNKSKKQSAFTVWLQEAAMPSGAPRVPFNPHG
jgi:hypothetical protein